MIADVISTNKKTAFLFCNEAIVRGALESDVKIVAFYPANLVLLGALAKTEGFPLSLSQLEVIVPKVVPKKAIDANIKALLMGYDSME